MASQERVQRERSIHRSDETTANSETADTKEELKADLDALLDEVDSVLEENAEEFVAGYVQKGGE